MAEIGSAVYIDSWNYLRPYAAEIQVDTANNRSLVQYGLNLHVTSGGHVASSGIDVWMRGYQNYIGYANYGAGTHTVFDRSEWIAHNSDGSGSATINWAFNTSGIGNWSGSATLNLTKINRYPVLNSGSNFTDRTNPVFNITAYGTYPIRARLEASGASRVSRDLSSKNSQTYTLQLTDAERKLLRSLSSNGKTLTVREVVAAVSGGKEIAWSYKDYTMTIVRKPAKVRKDGAWVNAFPYVRVNGQWKEAKPYIRVNGSWKEEK